MRHTASVTSLSWIPSEAVSGLPKLPFQMGTFHYDEVPPDELVAPAGSGGQPPGQPGGGIPERIEELRVADRFRFVNHLAGWIETVDGRIVDAGHTGGGAIGATRVRLGGGGWFVGASALPDRRNEPERGDGWVRFTQTAGGRTGVPAPRTVRRAPFVQWRAPIAWTTLTLTIHADGRNEYVVTGASAFPRHWVYGHDGRLAAKSGLTDFKQWWKRAFGRHTPWGDLDSAALVTEVETALERQLSSDLMGGDRTPKVRKLRPGDTLVQQGDPGATLFVLLDGVLRVEVDGLPIAELGPGAVLGERAVLEQGTRTATLAAVTSCRVAEIGGAEIAPDQLAALAEGHRREEQLGDGSGVCV